MKDSSLVRAAEAVRDGKASAMVSAGNTGATMALRAAADGPHQGCVAARRSPRRSPCRATTPTVLLDAGANAECQAELARPVRPDGRGVRPHPLRHRAARASACCRSARSRRRARRSSRRPTRCSTAPRRSGRRRHVHRQRRGPRRDDARRRRRRHRRLHRQRRPQDARGRHAHPRRAPSSRPSAPTTRPQAASDVLHARPPAALRHRSTPTTPAARCSSASTASASSATARRSATAIVNAVRVAKELHDAGDRRRPPGGRQPA